MRDKKRKKIAPGAAGQSTLSDFAEKKNHEKNDKKKKEKDKKTKSGGMIDLTGLEEMARGGSDAMDLEEMKSSDDDDFDLNSLLTETTTKQGTTHRKESMTLGSPSPLKKPTLPSPLPKKTLLELDSIEEDFSQELL